VDDLTISLMLVAIIFMLAVLGGTVIVVWIISWFLGPPGFVIKWVHDYEVRESRAE
jgi:phage shock protein PspC (stress-responsive transcriptional regulator)